MDRLQQQRTKSIEESRKKAFALARSEGPLGFVLSGSFDLMNSVVRKRIDNPDLDYGVEALTCERQLALLRDAKRNESIHKVAYGLTEGLEMMITSLRDRRGEGQGVPIEQSQLECNAEDNDSIVVVDPSIVKNEPMDSFFDSSASIIDEVEATPQSLRQHNTLTAQKDKIPLRAVQQEEMTPMSRTQHKSARAETSRKRSFVSYADASDDENEDVRSAVMARTNPSKTGRKHICNVCDYAFRSPAGLRVHSGTHTGIRPFACDMCDATYLASSALKAHHREKHDMLPYECATCDARFSKRQELYQHWNKDGHKPETAKEKKRRLSKTN